MANTTATTEQYVYLLDSRGKCRFSSRNRAEVRDLVKLATLYAGIPTVTAPSHQELIRRKRGLHVNPLESQSLSTFV